MVAAWNTAERRRRHRPGDAAPTYLSHRQILVILGGLMTGMFLAALDQSIVGTALPRITSDLNGLDKLSWVVTAYLLASTASTPLWGKISDLYGRRLIFQIAIVTFLVGSLLCGFSRNIEELIAFRALQGVGGGGLMALAFATIGDVIPPRERGRYMGYMGAVFGTSSVAGPLLGGWLADGPGWEWIFWLNVPIGIVALVVTSYALKLPHTRREHVIDWLGAGVLVAGVSSMLLYVSWAGPDHGWGSGLGLGLLAGALVLTALFIAIELRAKEPIIPMELFRGSIFRDDQRDVGRDGHVDVRRDHLRAALPADRHGHVADQVRPRHAADGHRPVLHVDPLGQLGHPDRPLPPAADREHGRRVHRSAGALDRRRATAPTGGSASACSSSVRVSA